MVHKWHHTVGGPNFQITLHFLFLLPSFLSSFLSSLLSSFLPSYLPSFLRISFLGLRHSFFPICLPSFLLSLVSFYLPSFLAFFLSFFFFSKTGLKLSEVGWNYFEILSYDPEKRNEILIDVYLMNHIDIDVHLSFSTFFLHLKLFHLLESAIHVVESAIWKLLISFIVSQIYLLIRASVNVLTSLYFSFLFLSSLFFWVHSTAVDKLSFENTIKI